MPSLPRLDVKTNINHSPHVVILGAGASKAALPNGDANGKHLPLMENMVSVLGMKNLLLRHGFDNEVNNFEKFFSDLSKSGKNPDLLQEIERRVHDYFSGLTLPDEPTLYDYLILSLRKTDLIATFNWDPFLAQAYRRNMLVTEPPRICFLHGNVAIGACVEHQRVGFSHQRCSVCDQPLRPSQLLYPVAQKDYQSDPHISSEWAVLRNFLNEAYYVTIFGYSAPVTDLEARKIMLDAWRGNATRDLAEIDVIDIRPREEIESNWKDYFVRQHYGILPDFSRSILNHHPRRSCDSFAMATLQQSPWKTNPWPAASTLEELHQWIEPLIEEERNGYFTGNPCPTNASL